MTEGDTLALVPARGGSKGIPRKNIVEFAGDPLLAHTVRAARKAANVDRTLVSTDDDEIRSVARECGADAPFLRPADLATDEAPTAPVVEHALDWLADRDERYDHLVLLQPTSPLRTRKDVEKALDRYRSADADSLVSVVPDHSFRWRRGSEGAERVNYDRDVRQRRQEKEPEYVENGAIYVVDVERFEADGDLQTGRTVLFEMPRERSIDIDTPFDRWLAERIFTDWQEGRAARNGR